MKATAYYNRHLEIKNLTFQLPRIVGVNVECTGFIEIISSYLFTFTKLRGSSKILVCNTKNRNSLHFYLIL